MIKRSTQCLRKEEGAMRWFKHHVNMSEGNSMMVVREKFGLTGYATYCILVEVLASKYTKEHDASNEIKFEVNRKYLKNKLSLNYKKIESILSLFSVLEMISYTKTEFSYFIEMPKLRSIKDDYTSKPKKCPDTSGTKSALELELELEKELENKKYIKKETGTVEALRPPP